MRRNYKISDINLYILRVKNKKSLWHYLERVFHYSELLQM